MKKFTLALFLCSMVPFQVFGDDIPRVYGPSQVLSGYKITRARGFFGESEHLYSGDIITGLYGYGYGTSLFSTSPGVAIKLKASQDWTNSAQGTKITFETTPNGSATAAESANIQTDGTSTLFYINPNLDITISSPTAVGQLGITSAGVLYVSTSAISTGSWVKVGAQ